MTTSRLISKDYIKKAIAKDNTRQDVRVPRFVQDILGNPGGQHIRPKNDPHDALLDIPLTTSIPAGYVVVFGTDGQHVALSTGKIEPIQGSAPQKVLNRDQGHGIMELDGKTDGVIKSTIEDAMQRGLGTYNSVVTWGVMPSYSD